MICEDKLSYCKFRYWWQYFICVLIMALGFSFIFVRTIESIAIDKDVKNTLLNGITNRKIIQTLGFIVLLAFVVILEKVNYD